MKLLRALLAAIVGLVGGYVLTAALGILLIDAKPGDSGGTAMGIFFGLAPVGAILGAIAGVVIVLNRLRKKDG